MYTFSASVWSPTRHTLAGYYDIKAETFAEAEQEAIARFHADFGEDQDCIVKELSREINTWA